tara:strand:+ start:605 stop:862 length:258 start_codon:yes stop_codon:yes gene_type:complete
MERMFDKLSLIRTLKDGIKKGYWTLEQLDIPPPGWQECVKNCEENPLFKKGYQGVKYVNLARQPEQKIIEQKVELTDPKDLPTQN